MPRLVLIDGHAIVHRAYHAYPQTLKTRKGELTNAVYGFTSILLTIMRQFRPKYIACAFDLPKPTFRHKEYKAYKAQRPKIDEELKKQIPKAKGIVKALNIPIFEKEGFEADDVIGTLAYKANVLKLKIKSEKAKITDKNAKFKKDLEIIIVTGDKDALQLVDNDIKVYLPPRGKQPAQMYDRRVFLQKYGFEPRQMVCFKALAGDASDNIPGVKGIGPKSAAELIIQFGNLENIYANLDKIKESWRLKLKSDEKNAFLSLKLAGIITDLPLKFNLSKCRLLDYNQEKVIQLFEILEFRSLINRLPGKEKARVKEKPEAVNKQMGLF